MKNEVDYQEEYERYADADAKEAELHQRLHGEYDGQYHDYPQQPAGGINAHINGYAYVGNRVVSTDASFVFKLLGGIFMGIGALIIIIGLIVTGIMQDRYDACTETTTAIVVENRLKDDTYAPVFAYTAEGRDYERISSYSTNPPKYRTGDEVELHYEPGDPENFYVDKSINLVRAVLYGIGGFFFVFGFVFFIIGIKAKKEQQRL